MENKFNEYKTMFRNILPIGETFDMIERNIIIGGKEAYFYYINAFVKDEILQHMMSGFLKINKVEMNQCTNSMDFIKNEISYISVIEETDIDTLVKYILSGQTVLIIDGFEKAMVMDLRTYPVRSIEEPEKEKSLRGSKDGFVETMVFNVALVRRRIRDPELIFKVFTVGKKTKTDVCVGFVKGLADEKQLQKIISKIEQMNVQGLTVAEQSLVEAMGKSGGINPFPRVRYTQRPDVVAAHLTEGKFVVIVDNSPTALLIPTSIFEFMQDVDDYYLPMLTGNYLRFIRTFNLFIILFSTPVYLLIAEGFIPIPSAMKFMIPDEGFAIPLFLQFILLEIAIDALKLASLSTPSSLGMSTSVIGALILGEFSIKTGWFIPQTILCMAVVALASFTHPSIELGYALKFMRIIILIGAIVFGVWGAVIGLIIDIIILATTKSLVGTSYLEPLIPFNWQKLKRLLFRTKAES